MDRIPSTLVEIPSNQPRELLARLYREIGVSAVAAALEPATLAADNAAQLATQGRPLAERVAA